MSLIPDDQLDEMERRARAVALSLGWLRGPENPERTTGSALVAVHTKAVFAVAEDAAKLVAEVRLLRNKLGLKRAALVGLEQEDAIDAALAKLDCGKVTTRQAAGFVMREMRGCANPMVVNERVHRWQEAWLSAAAERQANEAHTALSSPWASPCASCTHSRLAHPGAGRCYVHEPDEQECKCLLFMAEASKEKP